MKYDSPYEKFLGELIAPDNCRIDTSDYDNNPSIRLFIKNSSGKEYLLVRDTILFFYQREPDYERKWFDCRGKVHRNQNAGPAMIRAHNSGIYSRYYMKHNKIHRTDGSAFYTATNEELFHLDGKELNYEIWLDCVKNNNCKAPKPLKFNLSVLKQCAADLAKQARLDKDVSGIPISDDELPELDMASFPSSWRRHGSPELERNGTTEFCLNCEPLDDTLRAYIFIDKNGQIIKSFLQIE